MERPGKRRFLDLAELRSRVWHQKFTVLRTISMNYENLPVERQSITVCKLRRFWDVLLESELLFYPSQSERLGAQSHNVLPSITLLFRPHRMKWLSRQYSTISFSLATSFATLVKGLVGSKGWDHPEYTYLFLELLVALQKVTGVPMFALFHTSCATWCCACSEFIFLFR